MRCDHIFSHSISVSFHTPATIHHSPPISAPFPPPPPQPNTHNITMNGNVCESYTHSFWIDKNPFVRPNCFIIYFCMSLLIEVVPACLYICVCEWAHLWRECVSAGQTDKKDVIIDTLTVMTFSYFMCTYYSRPYYMCELVRCTTGQVVQKKINMYKHTDMQWQ